ncbi:hypothetical protein RIF29_05253 [Crotalaria pallida]|uniref:Uncharacterized protein n=1 Tax=Crotalaria pallida TaxID=3830 RepID=A0AAN9J2V5_CROPI
MSCVGKELDIYRSSSLSQKQYHHGKGVHFSGLNFFYCSSKFAPFTQEFCGVHQILLLLQQKVFQRQN